MLSEGLTLIRYLLCHVCNSTPSTSQGFINRNITHFLTSSYLHKFDSFGLSALTHYNFSFCTSILYSTNNPYIYAVLICGQWKAVLRVLFPELPKNLCCFIWEGRDRTGLCTFGRRWREESCFPVSHQRAGRISVMSKRGHRLNDIHPHER